jgi:hypothetical protein
VVDGSRREGFSRLQVCDGLFDFLADAIGGGVELFVPVEQIAMEGFLDRRDHAKLDVAFVADPILRVDPVQDVGGAQGDASPSWITLCVSLDRRRSAGRLGHYEEMPSV